jgi:hypothetical protein
MSGSAHSYAHRSQSLARVFLTRESGFKRPSNKRLRTKEVAEPSSDNDLDTEYGSLVEGDPKPLNHSSIRRKGVFARYNRAQGAKKVVHKTKNKKKRDKNRKPVAPVGSSSHSSGGILFGS